MSWCIGKQVDDECDERANRMASREKAQAWLLLKTLNPVLSGMRIRDNDLGARFGRQQWLGEDGSGSLPQASATATLPVSR